MLPPLEVQINATGESRQKHGDKDRVMVTSIKAGISFLVTYRHLQPSDSSIVLKNDSLMANTLVPSSSPTALPLPADKYQTGLLVQPSCETVGGNKKEPDLVKKKENNKIKKWPELPHFTELV